MEESEQEDDFAEINQLVDLTRPNLKITHKLLRRPHPQVLDNSFLIGEFLGKGVSAKVFEVLDMQSLERKAMKLYEFRSIFKLHNFEERVQMIRAEIDLLTRLKHPHLIRYTKIYSNEQGDIHLRDICIYAIMEYCVACVDDVMISYPLRRLPLVRAHKYFVQLIEAVEYLHSYGIIHKDIKTANMLIDLNDDIKLTDLGVCETVDLFDQKALCYKTNGSLIYQAPEIFDVEKQTFQGEPVDIWACGVVLYFMLSGHYPFEGKLLDLMDKIGHNDFCIPEHLQSEIHLIHLLYSLMAKKPTDRISITKLRRDAWFLWQPQHELCLPQLPYDLWVAQKRAAKVRLAPLCKYQDKYRSMSITPYLYQMHRPLQDVVNEVEVSEDEVEEFDNLRKIPLVRSNRFKPIRYKESKNDLWNQFIRALGLTTSS